MTGYGRNPPVAAWPKGARVALQFVINYEEGGENNILHGDKASEAFLSEIVGAQPWLGQRHMNMESIYEYGSRAGFWRLWRMFTERQVPVTVYGVATAMARNLEAVAAMREADWEIASHGLKWIDYKDAGAEAEKRDIDEAIRIHTQVTGSRPLGFYQGRSSIHTIPLAIEEQGFLYVADSYADDLPYWLEGAHGPQLAVPYTLDANDMRFATPQGFNSGGRGARRRWPASSTMRWRKAMSGCPAASTLRVTGSPITHRLAATGRAACRVAFSSSCSAMSSSIRRRSPRPPTAPG
jgi:peptidoglycan/xylan/chitin deacetylase (PgdA/CDA1 family)